MGLLSLDKRKITRKEPRKKQEKRMDDKYAVLLKLKKNLICDRCGHEYRLTDKFKIPGGCQCSHYIGRTKRTTRWMYLNTFCHCAGCHRYLGNHPEEFRAWVLEQYDYNEGCLLLLRAMSNQIFKGDRTAIELWIDEELRRELPKWPRLNYPFLDEFYEIPQMPNTQAQSLSVNEGDGEP